MAQRHSAKNFTALWMRADSLDSTTVSYHVPAIIYLRAYFVLMHLYAYIIRD